MSAPEASTAPGSTPAPSPSPLRARLPVVELALVAFAFLLVAARSLGRAHAVDVMFDDETGYLASGLELFRSGPPGGEAAPLYAAWYWLQSVVVADPLTLYDVNWSALLLANLLAIGAVLRRLGVGPLGIVAVLSIVSTSGFAESYPFVSLLASALVAVAVAAALGCGALAAALGVASVAFALATFVRPELALSFGLLLAACAAASLAARASARVTAFRVGVPLAVFAALTLAFGSPASGARSFMAFGQHYAVNVVRAQRSPIDPWNNWREITRESFGDAETVAGALAANPRAFLWHVELNARTIPKTLGAVLAPAVLPPPLAGWAAAAVAVLLAAGIVLAVARAWRGRRGGAGDERLRGAVLLTLAAASIAPILLSSLVVLPRRHYLVVPFAAVLALSTWGWAGALRGRWGALQRVQGRVAIAVACLVLLVLPARAGRGPWWAAREVLPLPPQRATLAAMRSIEPPRDRSTLVLESQFGRGVYLGWRFERLAQTECTPFEACLRDRRPDVIVLDRILARYYLPAGDAGFQAFVMFPESFGYRRVPVPGVPDGTVQLLVRGR